MSLPAINPFSPLGLVLNDIERAFHAKLYYPALLVSLTVPEVCEGLILDKSEIVKQKHYVGFVDKYAPQSELGVSGIECYRMRGGLVHRANFAGHPKAEWTNIVFSVPETNMEVHGLTMQGLNSRGEVEKMAIVLSLRNFCVTMVNAANRWYSANEGNPAMQNAMNDLIRWCPNGLPPFVGGAPVVASGA
jgi:hypothetical protein